MRLFKYVISLLTVYPISSKCLMRGDEIITLFLLFHAIKTYAIIRICLTTTNSVQCTQMLMHRNENFLTINACLDRTLQKQIDFILYNKPYNTHIYDIIHK